MYLIRNTEKQADIIQSRCLQELDEVIGHNMNKEYRDCIYFLDRIFEYAKGTEGLERAEHFSR